MENPMLSKRQRHVFHAENGHGVIVEANSAVTEVFLLLDTEQKK
jgi:hypothetical protein